ncbi:MAG: hypothetical protein Q7T89_14960 [Anaerolineales bacterium]|nr:hypothetical protein [Anaerolineales bacterium]
MKNFLATSLALIFLLTACTLPSAAPVDTPAPAATTAAPPTNIPTNTPVPTLAPPTETLTPTPVPPTNTPTAIPVVESLDATVTADLLSCRYGPGSEYLYLIAFNKSTPLKLLGRTDGNNWVLVKNEPQRCWVNTKFIEIKGDPQTLKVVYPDGYKLPVSPYYSAATVLSAVRDPNNSSKVTVKWTDITLRAGDEEDENMFIYIIEVWRCEGGKIIFDPLASNYPEVAFVDEAGCNVPSHGRVFFQEKHGFAGPAEIPWPTQ